jgi:hypothetical protein
MCHCQTEPYSSLCYWVLLVLWNFLCRANKNIVVYACDCSDETLEKAKEIITANAVDLFKHRFHTFCCDVSTNGFPNWLACNTCKDQFLQKQSCCLSGYYFALLWCFWYWLFVLTLDGMLRDFVISVFFQIIKRIMVCNLGIHAHQMNLTVVLEE